MDEVVCFCLELFLELFFLRNTKINLLLLDCNALSGQIYTIATHFWG